MTRGAISSSLPTTLAGKVTAVGSVRLSVYLFRSTFEPPDLWSWFLPTQRYASAELALAVCVRLSVYVYVCHKSTCGQIELDFGVDVFFDLSWTML